MLQLPPTNLDTQARLESLDDTWEDSAIEGLPFPIAHVLSRVRNEEAPWDLLLKDTLSVLLRYLAILGISEYLTEDCSPCHDLNDHIKNTGRVMLEGQWLALVRACAVREAPGRAMPCLASAIRRLELDRKNFVRLVFARHGIRTDPAGPLSTLVTARNKLFAHGITPSSEEKADASAKVRRLLRLVIDELSEVWSYTLCVPLPTPSGPKHFALRGLAEFSVVSAPENVGTSQTFLDLYGRPALVLHPLTIGDTANEENGGTLFEKSTELYLLNHLRRSMVPVYLGLAGGAPARPEFADAIAALFEPKQVWASRQDIELDSVLAYATACTAESLDFFEWNGFYDPVRHVERDDVQAELDRFLESDDTRILFLAGGSGSGKTATIIHWTRTLLGRRVPVCFLRAAEMPGKDTASPRQFQDWICAANGYAGQLDSILDRAQKGETRRFLIVVDGLNEFVGEEKDIEDLWRSIAGMAELQSHRVALKIIVTGRMDTNADLYFPNNELPRFARAIAFHCVEGKPWLDMPQLGVAEIEAILRSCGVEEAAASAATQSHTEKLGNPGLLIKFADGVATGADPRKLRKDVLTRQFVSHRLSDEPELAKLVDDLVGALIDHQAMQVPLDTIAEGNPRLHDRLSADDYRGLHRLRELELVSLHRTSDFQSRPTTSISLGHDSLFEELWYQRAKKLSLRSSVLMTAVLSLLIVLAAFGGTEILKRLITGDIDRVRTEAKQYLDSDAIAGHAEISPERTARLREQVDSLLGDADDQLHDFMSVAAKAIALNGVLLVLVVLGIWELLMQFGLWLQKRQQADFRIRYFAQAWDRRVIEIAFRVAIPIVVFGGIATFVFVVQAAMAAPKDTPEQIAFLFTPMFIALGLLCCCGPAGLSLICWRFVRESGSSLLRYIWFSRTAVFRNASANFRLLCLVGLELFLVLAVLRTSADNLWILGNELDASVTKLVGVGTELQQVALTIQETMAESGDHLVLPDFGEIEDAVREPWVPKEFQPVIWHVTLGGLILLMLGFVFGFVFDLVVSNRILKCDASTNPKG